MTFLDDDPENLDQRFFASASQQRNIFAYIWNILLIMRMLIVVYFEMWIIAFRPHVSNLKIVGRTIGALLFSRRLRDAKRRWKTSVKENPQDAEVAWKIYTDEMKTILVAESFPQGQQ